MPNSIQDREADPFWDPVRDIIHTLYVDQNLSLENVRTEMANKHQFNASKAQYELHFKRWGFRKNRTANEWKIIAHKISKRKREHKDINVYIDGMLVNPKKVWKESLRYRSISVPTRNISQMPSPRTPKGFTVGTPLKDTTPTQATTATIEAATTPVSVTTTPGFNSISTPIEISPVILECLPFCQFTSLFSRDEDFLSTVSRGDVSASVVLSEDVCSSVLDGFVEGEDGRKVQGFFSQTVKALIPANIFAGDLTNAHMAVSQMYGSSALDFLKLTMYLVSNNFFGATAKVSREVYEWIKRCSNNSLLEHLLSIGGPTIEALAENFFRLAIEADDVHIIKRMLKWGIDPNEKLCRDADDRPITPLQHACRVRRQLVQALIDGGAKANVPFWKGETRTPLTCLFIDDSDYNQDKEQVDPELVRLLLRAGAAVNPGFGESPLAKAAWRGNLEAVTLLISAGADVNFSPPDSNTTPLLNAICCRPGICNETVIGIARSLLQAGADAAASEISGSYYGTVLCYAMDRNNAELAQLLLDNRAPVTEQVFLSAIKHCNINIVKLLLKYGAQVNEQVIESAIENCRSELVCFLLNEAQEHIKPSCKNAALIKAIAYGKQDLIVSLNLSVTQLEINNSQAAADMEAALEAAAERGDVSVFQVLLGKGSRLRATASRSLGNSLLAAILSGRNDIAEILLAAGADVNAKKEGDTPLWAAIRQKDLGLVRKLLAAGAAVNGIALYNDSSVFTTSVLPAVVAWGHYPLILDIIAAGAELNAPIMDSRITALTVAVKKRDFELTKLLLDAGADINATAAAMFGRTALEAASQNNDIDMVQYLLDHGADPDEASLVAAISGSVELVQVLLAARRNRYTRFSKGYGCSALQWSIILKKASMIELLLLVGIDPNAILHWKPRDKRASSWNLAENKEKPTICYEQSALGTAIKIDKSDDLWILHMLLRGGADPNSIVIDSCPNNGMANSRKQTALLAAVDQNNVALVKALVVAGADANAKTGFGIERTPLQRAIERGRSDIVDVLLEHGADVNATPHDRYGATALQFAAIGGYVGLAHLLIERGADVNDLPAKLGGRTALEAAAEHGRIDMLKLLLNAGAQIIGPGSEQYARAREFASMNGHAAVRRLLETYYIQLLEKPIDWDPTWMDSEFFNNLSF